MHRRRCCLPRCLQAIGKPKCIGKPLQARLPAWIWLGLPQRLQVLRQHRQICMPQHSHMPRQSHPRRALHRLRHVQLLHLRQQALQYICRVLRWRHVRPFW